MNVVKIKCGRVKSSITRTLTFSESIVASTSLDMLEIQLKRLNEAWSEFVLLQNSLCEFCDNEGFVDPEAEYIEYEMKYLQAFSALSGAIRKHPDKASDETEKQNSSLLEKLDQTNSCKSVVLPKLVIPVFNGNYKDWPAFKDLFLGTIDSNPKLTSTQKFQYLKSFLGGEASDLLKHILCTQENYLEAWEKLESRYDKKNLIVHSFVKSFMSLPSFSNSSSNLETLRKLTNGADEVIRGLNAIQMNSRDPWLIYILLQKLDSDTKQAWSEKIESRDDCTIDEFLTFLQTRCNCFESCNSFNQSQKTVKGQNNIRAHFAQTKPSCPRCKEDHILPFCKTFLAMDTNARREFVKENSLCFNCLRVGHASNKCNSKFRCRSCNARHHSLVHDPQNTSLSSYTNNQHKNEQSSSSLSPQKTSTSLVSHHSLNYSVHSSTILPTAVVKVQDKFGSFQNLRVLLDSGSQVSFITERSLQRLGLPKKPSRIPIIGVASTSAGTTNGLISLKLHSRFNSSSIDIDFHVISKLTSMLPPLSFKLKTDQFLSLDLADPRFNEPAPIDMLIGADQIFNLILETSKSEPGVANSVLTIFGWVIAGSCDQLSHNESFVGVRAFCTQLDHSQEFDLERFWRLEEVNCEPILSIEEQKAEDHFIQTHRRHTDGRYMVDLPFKSNTSPSSANSFQIALNRLYSVEKRLLRDPDLKAQYSQFLNEYLSLGHMEEIPVEEINKPNSYYLPHHAVFKADSSTTKVRVVFDGSAKSSFDSRSLNESLFVGPEIQRDIFTICLRSRRHAYTISGDIEKMYRQIWISPNHTNYQRILWREDNGSSIKHYRLLTVTYGTSAASFLAKRALKQLALDSAKTHPRASSIILSDFYVDDVVTGADTIEDLIAIKEELVEVLSSAGLNLRKWTTNCWPLLLSLPEDQRELSPIDFENSLTVKILGLQWCPSKDCFSYKVNLDQSTSCTKRRILSEASRIFDPLGFLAPVVIAVKIFFQDLWRMSIGWDDQITQELSQRWVIIRDELNLVESFSIPRIMWMSKQNHEFHAFCDASLDAYAAVVYCRSLNLDGSVSTSLVAAKSKVAPIKVLSLPRLELCGALLLARLINKIKLSLQLNQMQVFAWTDSSIVLHWLLAPPKKWSVFIANRTSEIISIIPVKSWNHVRSADNPADVASRGIPPSQLASTEIWWRGPAWLRMERSKWPQSQHILDDVLSEQLEERKTNPVKVFVTNLNDNNILRQIIAKSSNWIKSVRVVAYIFRFLENLRLTPESYNLRPLSSKDLDNAQFALIRSAQSALFSVEIETLKMKKSLPSRNKLLSLAPFLDNINILRVGGRLTNSGLSFNEKHPIILCKSHAITKLIIEYTHRHHLHAGASLMMSLLKQKYYVLGCRNVIRTVVAKCLHCFKQRKATSEQLMGNLPVERVRFARPFSKVGCDYAGPITLRLARGRNPKFVKGYIALFVCFVTKGIHIELVSDLSSSAFLLALDRFVSRRGKPTEIWSDNATNFHGARRLLGEMHEHLMNQQRNNAIADHLSKDAIDWKFIPPSAPHFGGLWEAGVKSVKQHLKRVIGEHILTYEEMYTLLAKIECLLNSRPMWQTSDFEPIALTPSHFMIGESYCAIPSPDLNISNFSISSNWYLLQTLMQGFWKQWHKEYLTSLQNRPKWQNTRQNLQLNDVVLLKEPNLPPSKWILGRIINVHPGKDDRCRVVTVRTTNGDYVRPIVKIAPLPLSERPESSRGG